MATLGNYSHYKTTKNSISHRAQPTSEDEYPVVTIWATDEAQTVYFTHNEYTESQATYE
jgi:heme-degrading monooxygenase HmoA